MACLLTVLTVTLVILNLTLSLINNTSDDSNSYSQSSDNNLWNWLLHLLGLLDDDFDLSGDLVNNNLLSLFNDLLGDNGNVLNGDLQMFLSLLQDNLLLLDNQLSLDDLLVGLNLL